MGPTRQPGGEVDASARAPSIAPSRGARMASLGGELDTLMLPEGGKSEEPNMTPAAAPCERGHDAAQRANRLQTDNRP